MTTISYVVFLITIIFINALIILLIIKYGVPFLRCSFSLFTLFILVLIIAFIIIGLISFLSN